MRLLSSCSTPRKGFTPLSTGRHWQQRFLSSCFFVSDSVHTILDRTRKFADLFLLLYRSPVDHAGGNVPVSTSVSISGTLVHRVQDAQLHSLGWFCRCRQPPHEPNNTVLHVALQPEFGHRLVTEVRTLLGGHAEEIPLV